ncbi:hypothetical protein DB346_10990 [Verrucomicrobia bacterium LW23]|nr:hypothetical protein DB346_10990 [Verrucomicrobia bacterium LW23]
MYRHGLGDCHLITFFSKPARQGDPQPRPIHMLIDFGVLNRDADHMRKYAENIRESTKLANQDDVRVFGSESRIDILVVTHEHRDHLSGFNQCREIFDSISIGAVWMAWTENPEDPVARNLAKTREKATSALRLAARHPRLAAVPAAQNANTILTFFDDDDNAPIGRRTIRQALEYVRSRGTGPRSSISYLTPGDGPFTLKSRPGETLKIPGVADVNVYVLAPPTKTDLLKHSTVTRQDKDDGWIFHFGRSIGSYLEATCAALAAAPTSGAEPEKMRRGGTLTSDTYQPFTNVHRIEYGGPSDSQEKSQKQVKSQQPLPTPARPWPEIADFFDHSYYQTENAWRKIDDDWLAGIEHLSLKLDEDTNNTSLVLAFELTATSNVLLFVGDMQVGGWRSLENVHFPIPVPPETPPSAQTPPPLSAHDLLARTVFYKVGHHASHNATTKKGGLDLMATREQRKLVAFIPLDRKTAEKQGKRGWKMPAEELYKALIAKTGNCTVISGESQPSPEAKAAGVRAEPLFFEYTVS